MSYLNYWSLRYPPFSTSSFFFPTRARRQILCAIEDSLAAPATRLLLVGPQGCGTSTLMQQVASVRGVGDFAVEAVKTIGAPSLALFASKLGVTVDQLTQTLNRSRRQSLRTLWLIDNNHAANQKLISDFAHQHPSLLVVSTAQPSEVDFGQQNHGQRQIRFQAWTPAESEAFIDRSLRAAGCYAKVFDSATICALQRESGGRIRDLCKLTERALVIAAQRKSRRITPSDVTATVEHRRAA